MGSRVRNSQNIFMEVNQSLGERKETKKGEADLVTVTQSMSTPILGSSRTGESSSSREGTA
jgi:hypothetical protein